MIARFFQTACILLALPGTTTEAAEPPANSPLHTAGAGAKVSATKQVKDAPETARTDVAGEPDAKQSPRTDEQTQRVRELIYCFRTYRVFCRDEEWAQTIRELARIGKGAVPELVAELDRTDRDATLRSLAFCLRAIGDQRAVPALIRAIPKALRPPGSDCGVQIVDPDLRSFMLAHQNYKDDKATHVACGRPVNEIISALERVTKHREPPDVGDNDPLRHVFLGGTPEQQAQQRALFEQRQKRWQAWWSQHWQEFVTQAELQSVERPKRDEDLVEMAGVARFGMLFPTGSQVRLGPVRRLRLQRTRMGANARSHLDFDTGRLFEQYEGMTTVDWGQPAVRIANQRLVSSERYRRSLPRSARRRRSAALADRRQSMEHPRSRDSERQASGAWPGSNQFAGTVRKKLDRLQTRRTGDVSVYDARGRTRYRPGFSQRSRQRSVSSAVQDVADRPGQARTDRRSSPRATDRWTARG